MFRFTIRDVLWLMVVVGMGCAWWLDRGALNRERHQLRLDRAGMQHLLAKSENHVMMVQTMLKSAKKELAERRANASAKREGLPTATTAPLPHE